MQQFENTGIFTGVEKPVYAVKTGKKSYTTPKQLSWAANIAVNPVLGKNKKAGDNAIRRTTSKLVGYDGTAELLNITVEDLAILRGQTYQNGKRLKNKTDTPVEVAMGFEETRDDGSSVYHWYYVCKFDEPTAGGETEGESINYRNVSMPFSVSVDEDGDLELELDSADPAHTPEEAASWFDGVQFFNSDTTPPVLSDSTPVDGEVGVAVDSTIELVFNKQMNITSFENIVVLEGGTTQVDVSIAVSSDGTTVTLTPDSNLTAATAYTIAMINVKDTLGQQMPYETISFTTA